MAEAFVREFGGDKVEVFSAGVKASGAIYPWAIKLMAEKGIDISQQTSDQVDQYFDIQFDYLITVCDNAQETCPIFPKAVGTLLHQSFPDYVPQGKMSDEEYMNSMRPIRDAISVYCQEFVKKL
jgi:arsenate reductase